MAYTEVTSEQAQAMLEQWGAGTLTAIAPLSGGWANSNYRVDRQGARPLVLKLYDECSVEAAARLARQAVWLAQHGVPTPAPLAADDGRLVWEHERRAWMLQPFVDGHWLEPTPAAMEHLGRALGGLHEVPAPPDLSDGFGMGFGLYDRLFARADAEDAWSPFLRDLRRDAAQLRRDIPADLPRGMIHGDLFPDNMLFRGDRLAAILDFEEVCRDWLALDLTMTFVGCGWRDGLPVAELWDALLRGYESIRTLTAAETTALPHLHRHATLGIAAWRYGQFVMSRPELGLGNRYEEMTRRLGAELPF